MIETFKSGWRLAHLPSVSEMVDQADQAGFTVVEQRNLSQLLRLNRLRDHVLKVVAPLADSLGLGRFALFANMIGGNALTQSHQLGIMRYMMFVLHVQEH
jgi:hypothetical protein